MIIISITKDDYGQVINWSVRSNKYEITDVKLKMQDVTTYPRLRYHNPSIEFTYYNKTLGG